MPYDFDQVIPRRGTGSAKWEHYPEDVLPMWVADMDFASPEPLVRALHERAAQATFGYSSPHRALAEAVAARMERLYGWRVAPEHVVPVPSLVSAINVTCRAIGEPGDGVLNLTPAYPPFLTAPGYQGRAAETAPLALAVEGRALRYELDLDALAGALGGRTRLLLLSNPHNPVGVAYDPAALRQIAELCLRNDTVICADEIHSELLLGDTRHTPMAGLAPEIAARTITLISPSKTFNVPGLGCGIAIISDPELRRRFGQAGAGIVPNVNAMGLAAARAAFEECDGWLEALRAYLTANRDFLLAYVARHMPALRTTAPAATYLAWVDCREAGIEGSPYKFFLEQARVALSDGTAFGPGGEGFVRINFGCPRALLAEGLERMAAALARAAG
ncbi:MAG TPA: PatB family C-S lyase [Chloroflexaceae bacterium]|nr:PatB family C-S lyase [Chloroflexaceae bacterium]